MPLLDHFHAPLAPTRHWESFHANGAGAIADARNEHLLPEGYFAEEHTRRGAFKVSAVNPERPRSRPPSRDEAIRAREQGQEFWQRLATSS